MEHFRLTKNAIYNKDYSINPSEILTIKHMPKFSVLSKEGEAIDEFLEILKGENSDLELMIRIYEGKYYIAYDYRNEVRGK